MRKCPTHPPLQENIFFTKWADAFSTAKPTQGLKANVLRCVRHCGRCWLRIFCGWLPGVSFWELNSCYTGVAAMGRHRPNLSLREPVTRNVDGWQLPAATPQGSTTALTPRPCSYWAVPRQGVSTLGSGHFSSVQDFCTGQACPGLPISLAQNSFKFPCHQAVFLPNLPPFSLP